MKLHFRIVPHPLWKFVPGHFQADCRLWTHSTSFNLDLCGILLTFNTPGNLGLGEI